ncbi:hypothetical protein EMCG_02494 [[Emmonsia] crescens]|uniref:Uncharacterized protein n=1 Tax=[Emmonsia] crescens TaxID=73230 RepID=A0A0G2HXU1_9EURO|nr:hypothetical protein EMCG_02494 [Emmonsia crescens UAMH 3008]
MRVHIALSSPRLTNYSHNRTHAFGTNKPKGTLPTTASEATKPSLRPLSPLPLFTSVSILLTHLALLQAALRNPSFVLVGLSAHNPLVPQNIKLPHRTSLQVLPLQEEESRRLGPVNFGCVETFRPP